MNKDKLPPIIQVTWKDSWFNPQPWTIEELKNEPDYILHSVGYLIQRDQRGINIATEYRIEDQKFRHVQHIPLSLVVKITKMVPSSSRRR